MNVRVAASTILFAATCFLGCASRQETPETTVSPPTSKTTMATFVPIDGAPTLTEDALRQFESKHHCTLPDDYRRFMLRNNGGFPSPDCVTFKEAGRRTATDVFCFQSIGDNRAWASMEWHLDSFAGRLPKDTLPIGHDSCGNLWLLSVGPETVGSVIFWDHGSFDTFDETDFANWPLVAASFQEFIDNLSAYQPMPEDDELLSRYALVERAVDGLAQKPEGFGKHSALGFVWHCDFGNGSNVRMQCVNYEVHAIATHTDGYSRLREMKGLIQEGSMRLPH